MDAERNLWANNDLTGSFFFLLMFEDVILHKINFSFSIDQLILRSPPPFFKIFLFYNFVGGESGPVVFYALATVAHNTLEGNTANANETIGIVIGGSSPSKMTVTDMICSGNSPTAVCKDPRQGT
jgi:parallel beta-helix repeat protein